MIFTSRCSKALTTSVITFSVHPCLKLATKAALFLFITKKITSCRYTRYLHAPSSSQSLLSVALCIGNVIKGFPAKSVPPAKQITVSNICRE